MAERNFMAVLPDGFSEDSAAELAQLTRELALTTSGSTSIVLIGGEVGDQPERLRTLFDEVFAFEHAEFREPDGDLFASIVLTLIERENPWCLVLPHSNNAMDMAPAISIRSGRPLVTDCVAVSIEEAKLSVLRPVYGGKLLARVTTTASDRGFVLTLRPGSVRVEEGGAASRPGADGQVRSEAVPDLIERRRRVLSTVEADSSGVDITQAQRIVAVGRGIEHEDNLEIITSLADAIGAEVACSRPVVDKQWMEKNRQVGTSGVTVKPSLYIAVGISGSFQHLGGIKGDPMLVAINKDARAPIFDTADIGVVGDLFDIVPLLDQRIRSLKS